MDQVEQVNGEPPEITAGRRLRDARQAADLSLDDISTRTKIARRHLEAIEEDRFGDLASRAYAIGFARTYARAVGLDEAQVTEAVGIQLDRAEDLRRPAPAEQFEPGDPARVPPPQLALIAGLGAVVVIVLLYIFWRSFLAPAGALPEIVPPTPVVSASAQPSDVASPQATSGPVTITAMQQDVWVKVEDASGKQLFQKEMALGETYTVPEGANGPVLATARPDQLQLAVGGRVLPRLASGPQVMRGIALDPQALVARLEPTAAPAPAGPVTSPAPAAQSTPVVAPTPVHRAAPPPVLPDPAPTPSRSAHSTAKATRTPAPASSATAVEAPTPSRTGTSTTPTATASPVAMTTRLPQPRVSASAIAPVTSPVVQTSTVSE